MCSIIAASGPHLYATWDWLSIQSCRPVLPDSLEFDIYIRTYEAEHLNLLCLMSFMSEGLVGVCGTDTSHSLATEQAFDSCDITTLLVYNM